MSVNYIKNTPRRYIIITKYKLSPWHNKNNSLNLLYWPQITVFGGVERHFQQYYSVWWCWTPLSTLLQYLLVFNATFNNISVISWRSVLLVEETRGPGENHRPVTIHWQTWSHNVEHQITVHNIKKFNRYTEMSALPKCKTILCYTCDKIFLIILTYSTIQTN